MYLESRGLGAYAPRIRALGARKVADLQLLSDEEFFALEDLCVAPFVRIYDESTATVARALNPALSSPPRFSFPDGIGEA